MAIASWLTKNLCWLEGALLNSRAPALARSARMSLPTHQKIPQRLKHVFKRIRAKKHRLVVGRVILVTRNGFQIQFSKFCFVHCLQFSRRRQKAGAVCF